MTHIREICLCADMLHKQALVPALPVWAYALLPYSLGRADSQEGQWWHNVMSIYNPKHPCLGVLGHLFNL
jgi:hypothetical protein